MRKKREQEKKKVLLQVKLTQQQYDTFINHLKDGGFNVEKQKAEIVRRLLRLFDDLSSFPFLRDWWLQISPLPEEKIKEKYGKESAERN